MCVWLGREKEWVGDKGGGRGKLNGMVWVIKKARLRSWRIRWGGRGEGGIIILLLLLR